MYCSKLSICSCDLKFFFSCNFQHAVHKNGICSHHLCIIFCLRKNESHTSLQHNDRASSFVWTVPLSVKFSAVVHSLVTSLPVITLVTCQLPVLCEFVPSCLISVITLMLVIPASLSRAVSFFDGGCAYGAGAGGFGHPYWQPWLWPSETDRGQEPWGISALPPGLLSPAPAPSPSSPTPSRPLLISPDSAWVTCSCGGGWDGLHLVI